MILYRFVGYLWKSYPISSPDSLVSSHASDSVKGYQTAYLGPIFGNVAISLFYEVSRLFLQTKRSPVYRISAIKRSELEADPDLRLELRVSINVALILIAQ
jgi:hypothetical protein